MKIIFAGGGTAGHVEPALAIARLWRERNPEDSIIFLGTAKGLENQLVPAANFDLNSQSSNATKNFPFIDKCPIRFF